MLKYSFKSPTATSLTFLFMTKVHSFLTLQRKVADCATGKPYATPSIQYNTNIWGK